MGPNQHTLTTLVITPTTFPLGFVQVGTGKHFPTTKTLWWVDSRVFHKPVGGPTSFSPTGSYFLAVVLRWCACAGQ